MTGTFNFNGRFGCYQFSQDHTSFQFPMAGSFTTFGSGCRGTAGTPYLFSPDVPFVGEKLPLVIANLPPTAMVLLVLGGSSSIWSGIPLPFNLGAIGAPGCNLYASPDLLLPVTNYNGTAFLSFLPAGASAGPVPFFVQGVALDPAANTLGAVFSNAGRGTFGVR